MEGIRVKIDQSIKLYLNQKLLFFQLECQVHCFRKMTNQRIKAWDFAKMKQT